MATVALLRAWAKEKASESERVGNEWSSEVASVFTLLRPNRLGQRRCTAATWRAWTALGRPLMAWRLRPSGPNSVTDSASSATSIS